MVKVDHFLDGFFNPESVAIVGATSNPLKMNFRLLENLIKLKYDGVIYPVNPNAKEILGIKAFARLKDIPGKVHLVVSAVPVQHTMDVVRECKAIGAKQLVIVSGGFSEGGESGRVLHEQLAAFVDENGIRTLGPNTLSPVNTANNFAISFNPIRKLNRGGLSFAFQSGFYEPMINWLFSHLGINKMLDMGNKIDINEVDALEYFELDPETEILAMHIESIKGHGRNFYNQLRSLAHKKPVIILKSGRTPSGSKAAASHTGSLAGENDAVLDGIIRQAGAVRARNLEEFFDFAKAFHFLNLPKGNRIAIITFSGGEGVMATDASDIYGLELAKISNSTRSKLQNIFPPWEIPTNPFDAGVCMQFQISNLMTFFNVLSSIPTDQDTDCAVMQLMLWSFHESTNSKELSEPEIDPLRQMYIQWLEGIQKSGKPFALWCSSSGTDGQGLIEQIESHHIPVFPSSERAIKALSILNDYRSRRQSK
jgi:acyl-CoA synthetase (NDP forming)